MGLFASRVFREREVITEYTGRLISRSEAVKMRREGRSSHLRGLNYDLIIDGDRNPITGQGIAQFANDGTFLGINNTKFITTWDYLTGRHRCFIKATRSIQPHEEIFVGYGAHYWNIRP